MDRIRECWPDARFIFLLRHPAMIARSRAKYIEAGAETADDKNVALIKLYCETLEDAVEPAGSRDRSQRVGL